MRRQRRLRGRFVSRTAVVGLFAVAGTGLVVPPSWAATTLSTTVVSKSATGPNAANTEVVAAANCSGKLVSGGGARVDVTTGTMPNGLKVDGTVPSKNGSTQDTNGDTKPAWLLGAGGGGGQAPSKAETWAYGMCIGSGTGHGPAATVVEVASVSGPNTADTTAKATVSCPTGDRLLGGGARTSPGTVGSLKIIGSFPTTPPASPSRPGPTQARGRRSG